jgi:flagellar hook assembly protein FlgD
MKPMKHTSPLILLAAATTAGAASFTEIPLLPEEGVGVLDRTVAREFLDRDLFGLPWATAVVGNVDVYDRFPYVEARWFQIVSDPAWNRLLAGELGGGLTAHDGRGDAFGALAGPRGLSVDAAGRLFVADTDNHRVLAYETWTEYDRIELRPLFAIEDLSRPYDVAHSDGGTPFDSSDDRLYVAETGRNRVVAFALSASGAERAAEIGELGSGAGRFAGPTALAVGRAEGANTTDVYVADSHNGRIVRLADLGDRFDWRGAAAHPGGLATSLDTDHWGNVYAAFPQASAIAKYSSELVPLARLDGVERPRGFHVPFFNRRDHRDGSISRAGHGSGLLVEEWTGSSGIRLVRLGIEVADLRVDARSGLSAEFVLTDRGDVRGEILEAGSGRVVHVQELGARSAGPQAFALGGAELADKLFDGEYVLRVSAASSYEGTPSDAKEMRFVWAGGPARVLPRAATLLGNEPNPFRRDTSIRFAIPEGPVRPVSLRVYDLSGRLVRTLADGELDAGYHSLSWDGRDGDGRAVAAGVYLTRLSTGADVSNGKLVYLR